LAAVLASKVGVVGISIPYPLAIVAIAVAYVVFAEIGFSLAFATKQVTAVWPPTGIAVAALLLCGYRVWPGVWLGAFISNAVSHEPALTAAGIATGNTLGPLLGVFLLRRFVDFDTALERLRDVLGLVILASAFAMTVTATNGVLNLALSGIVPWSDYASVWRVWWAGDAMGVLLVAPLILTWGTARKRVEHKGPNALEVVLLAVALVAVAWLSFMSSLPLAYPVYPFVIWTALRFGQRETAAAIAALSAMAIWGTTHHLGPFSGGSFDHRLILLVTFMAVLAVTGLVLGAVTAERQSAAARLAEAQRELRGREAQLEAAEQRFQVLAETVPQIVWTADATGWIDWYNHRWYEYTGQTREEAAGWGWQRAYHPEDLPRVMQDWPLSIATGEPFDMELRIRRSDELFRWFLVRAEPLRDAARSIVRWYGTNTDIDGQKRTLEKTTRIADTLAAAFLPDRLPQRDDLRFDALYLAAGHEALIGGDWYDAFELPDGSIVVSIGDVIGHGLAAAVTAGRIRQVIFATALDAPDPAAILVKVNRTLRYQEDTVATALVAILDRGLGTMRYASAGHPPPIIAGPTIAVRSLSYGGVPLGVEASLDIETFAVTLERDAVLLFYTDGITEFRRDIDETERALRDAVARLARNPSTPRPALTVRREVMGSQSPTDDAVLMVVQLSRAEETPGPLDQVSARKTWSFHSSDAYSAQATRHELLSFMRRFVASEEELFSAELVLGEILANTVEHAPGLVRIEIDWEAAHPVVTVLDAGPGLAALAKSLPEDLLVENGRGLFLISTLAMDVRLESLPGRGTKMVVVLPASRTP
jgi:PAS domain S-box-containing protein